MSIERRYSLLRHQHTIEDFQDWGLLTSTADWWGKIPYVMTDGVMEIGKYIDFHESDDDADDFDYRLTSTSGRLYTSGSVVVGNRLFAQGATNSLPTLGYGDESTSLVLGYSGDFAYGLLAGVLSSGISWIQSARFDGTATAYDLHLQPLGGGVLLAKTGSKGYTRVNEGTASYPGYLEHYTPDGTRRSYIGYSDGSSPGRVMWQSENGWGLAIHSAETLKLNTGGAGNTDIGNWSSGSTVNVYGDNGNVCSFITDDATTVYCRLFAGSGGTLRSYWYADASGHGLLGADGAWDLLFDQSTSSLTLNGGCYIPSGRGYFVDGAGGANYICYNSGSTYSGLMIAGHKNAYAGIYISYSGMNYMFDSSGNGGLYREAVPRWCNYYSVADDCTAFGGSAVSGSYRIYVTGSAYATGTWTASDGRKKENVYTIPYALHALSKLRGVSYNWKADAEVGQDPTQRHIGVIAQEVQAVVPEAVHYAADADSYAVDYNGLVGLLIQAVNELKERVDELETERSR